MGMIDWLITIFLVFAVWHGLRRGLVGMLLNLAGIVAVFFLVGHFFSLVKSALINKFGFNEIMAWVVGLLLFFVFVYLISRIVRSLVERTMLIWNLSFFNRILGGFLGLLCGLGIVIVFTLIIDYIPSARDKLKDPVQHRVYSAIEVIKQEALIRWDLAAKVRLAQFSQEGTEKQ